MNLNAFADFIEQLGGKHTMTRTEVADRLEAFGNELLADAKRIRTTPFNPFASPSGVGDRCRIQVVGPNGETKADKYHNW